MATYAQESGFVPAFGQHDRLRKALDVSGKSVQEAAEYLGVTRQTVNNWTGGRRRPNRMVLMAWAALTGVSLKWLETGVAPQPKPEGAADEYAIRDSNPEPADLKHHRPDLRGVRLVAA